MTLNSVLLYRLTRRGRETVGLIGTSERSAREHKIPNGNWEELNSPLRHFNKDKAGRYSGNPLILVCHHLAQKSALLAALIHRARWVFERKILSSEFRHLKTRLDWYKTGKIMRSSWRKVDENENVISFAYLPITGITTIKIWRILTKYNRVLPTSKNEGDAWLSKRRHWTSNYRDLQHTVLMW